jgi:putative ABC transport system ATP-binding protein
MSTIRPRSESGATSNSPTILAQGVHRSFGIGAATNHVLRGIWIAVESAALTLIVGPSGSGKSTLLAVLSGLLRPDKGSVLVLGQRLWDRSPQAIDAFRLAHCGFIFQGFNLFGALTAVEQVALVLNHAGVTGHPAWQQATEALVAVGLGDRLHLRPGELSGGEKQRVAIARAFVKKPELIFADEPTSALDKENGRIVIELLHRAAVARGTTVLCVSHDPRLVEHADRVIHIEDGCIVADELRQQPVLSPA